MPIAFLCADLFPKIFVAEDIVVFDLVLVCILFAALCCNDVWYFIRHEFPWTLFILGNARVNDLVENDDRPVLETMESVVGDWKNGTAIRDISVLNRLDLHPQPVAILILLLRNPCPLFDLSYVS